MKFHQRYGIMIVLGVLLLLQFHPTGLVVAALLGMGAVGMVYGLWGE